MIEKVKLLSYLLQLKMKLCAQGLNTESVFSGASEPLGVRGLPRQPKQQVCLRSTVINIGKSDFTGSTDGPVLTALSFFK